jgi:hypothetical protein
MCITSMINVMGRAHTLGQEEVFIQVASRMTSGMASVKCIGKRIPSIGENGFRECNTGKERFGIKAL